MSSFTHTRTERHNKMIDDNKYMFMITGAPGSGKSTLAQKLQHKAPKYINPIDRICEADQYFYVVGKGKYAFDPKLLGKAHTWCQNKAKEAMFSGLNLIVSNTNIKPRDRYVYFELAQKYGYKVVYIHLTTQYKNVHDVPDEVVNRMRENYIDLNENEKKLVIDFKDMPSKLWALLVECGL